MAKKKNLNNVQTPPETEILYHTEDGITADGAIDKYWKELAGKIWNEDTQKRYRVKYETYILPHFRNKAMASFDDPKFFSEVFDDIRRRKDAEAQERTRRRTIRERKSRTKCKQNSSLGNDSAAETAANAKDAKSNEEPPDEDSVHHFEYLTRRLFRIVAEKEGFANPFLGTNFAKKTIVPLEDVEIMRRTDLMKSLSPYQEYRIADILFSNPMCTGPQAGLLAQWIWGLRNGEACGLTFGDLQPHPELPGKYIVIVHTSLIPHTRIAYSYGKTSNFYRILPCPPKAYHFFQDRKARIQEALKKKNTDKQDNANTQLPAWVKSADDLPIACKGNDWGMRLKSDELNQFAKKIFADLKMTDDQFAFFSAKPNDTDFLDALAYDKNFTAYVCRRNRITSWSNLGWPRHFLERAAGHKLSNPSFSSHDFSNPEMIATMCEYAEGQPILYDIEDILYQSTTSLSQLRDVTHLHTSIQFKGGSTRIRIVPYLPHESLDIHVRTKGKSNVKPVDAYYRQQPSMMPLPHAVLLQKEYHDSYREAYRKAKPYLVSPYVVVSLRKKAKIQRLRAKAEGATAFTTTPFAGHKRFVVRAIKRRW